MVNIKERRVVAPHAGAWIEIDKELKENHQIVVAPHAGAWIEMLVLPSGRKMYTSLPTRERGLKFSNTYTFSIYI